MYPLQFAVNNTFNRSIQNTPSKLLFGIDQIGEPTNYVRLYLQALNESENEQRNFDKTRQNAQENLRIGQPNNKVYYDSTKRPATEYSVGEYVMIKNVDTTTL